MTPKARFHIQFIKAVSIRLVHYWNVKGILGAFFLGLIISGLALVYL